MQMKNSLVLASECTKNRSVAGFTRTHWGAYRANRPVAGFMGEGK